MREYQVCTNCVMDTTDSKIVFDNNGMCDHCRNYYENILPNWHTDERGKQELDAILAKIKDNGRNKKYDCIIGLSGGLDSSYLAYISVKKWGLNPLIYIVDTGWNLPVANDNISKIVKKLNLEAHTDTVDFEQMADLQLAYFKSQVAYQDIQDHIIFSSLYNYAVKHKVKYVLTGANFSTECIRVPVEWCHVNDITQIRDIYKKFGTKQMDKLPSCGMFKYQLYYKYFKGMKVVQPLNFITYKKHEVIRLLHEKFGFQPYAHKHYENMFTRFFEGYWAIKKFGYDTRKVSLSSLILTEQLKREEALTVLSQPPYLEEQAQQDMEYISNKLGITKEKFIKLMAEPNKTYKDYKSSKNMIELAVKIAKVVGMEKRNYR